MIYALSPEYEQNHKIASFKDEFKVYLNRMVQLNLMNAHEKLVLRSTIYFYNLFIWIA